MLYSGRAWLSSIRVLRCLINFVKRMQPLAYVTFMSNCYCKIEEGGDNVKSLCALWKRLHMWYNGSYNRRLFSNKML